MIPDEQIQKEIMFFVTFACIFFTVMLQRCNMAAVQISLHKVWVDPVPLSQISLFMNAKTSKCMYVARRQILSSVLELQLHSPTQDKRAVVNTLMDRAKALKTAQRQSEKRRVINDFKPSGYPKNFIKSV